MPLSINLSDIGTVAKGNPIDAKSVGSVLLDRDAIHESFAWIIGCAVIGIFAISVFFSLHLTSLLFTKFNATDCKDFGAFVKDGLSPLLKEIATTISTIFGSTLGFVLGYYFKTESANKKP
jgi:hypothetical protein